MVANIVTKPLELLLIVAAHMVFNVPSQAEVTGIVGTNISLQFTFNVSLTKTSHFGVYITDKKKIAEYTHGRERGIFDIYPTNSSVFWHIKNLTLNDSGSYWATLFIDPGPPQESNKVQLIVREEEEEDRSSTVPPMQSTVPRNDNNGSSIVTVLVVSPAVLLTVFLTCLIWCLVRTKDEQQQQAPQQQQQSSNPTVKERAETSEDVPAPSLIYSVLDFPKRPLEDLQVNPSDTEYAAVSPMQAVISHKR